MHIPKTSGTGMTAGLAEAISPRLTVSAFDRVLFGSFDRFETFSPEQRARVYLDAAEMPADIDMVAGHFARSTLRARYPRAQLITFLREPLTRLLSHWLFWRCQTDDILEGLGDWIAFVVRARGTLASFLQCPEIACQTDNITVRMLLSPHPLVPSDGFLDPRYDDTLLFKTLKRLNGFDHADIVENPDLERNVGAWLHCPFRRHRLNETERVPPDMRRSLAEELTHDTLAILHTRTRLDLRLWSALASRRLPATNLSALRERTILQAVARYATLLAP